MSPNKALKQCRAALEHANTYQTWHEAALELDRLEGKEEWKRTDESPYYDYELIRQRYYHVRNCRRAKDIPQLIYSLREGLQRNLGNLGNPELYKQTHVGTKCLIDEYISEICSALDYLCDNEFEEWPYPQKFEFFQETAQSFGRSGLLLSGGANLGFFHIGVVKALWEQKLMPHVISGSSAGAIVAASVGTHTDEELEELFDPTALDLEAWQPLSWKERLQQKCLMNVEQLQRCIRHNIGEYSFLEAFQRTKRVVNITVSPVTKNQQPHLMNYLTSPHLLLWSAAQASCAVPGLFPPVSLNAKDRNGRLVPYMSATKWVDGAIQSDLPMKRLSELYNVNHYIVSQTNPHVLPFMMERKRKDGLVAFARNLVGTEVQYRAKQVLKIASQFARPGMPRQVLDDMYAIVNQQYYGDITIYPKIALHYYQRLITTPTLGDVHELMLVGERAAWAAMSMVRDQTKIGQTLEDCLLRLEHQRHRRMEDHQSAIPAFPLKWRVV